jgi:hypothetical protein
MKQSISTLSFLLFLGVAAISTQACKGSTKDNSTSSEVTFSENHQSGEVKAYYFHATRRCATCQAVESVSREAIEEYYGNAVVFESINREVEKDNPLVEKYKISGQTLLIVNGDKKVNLTNDAFLNARTNPEKLKAKLKETIDSLM